MYPAKIIAFFFLLCSVYPSYAKFATGMGAAGKVAEVISHMIKYGTKRAVVINNPADDWMRVWCASKDDATGEKRVNPGQGMSFAFTPYAGHAKTVFWCTVNYKTYWARWDVFGRDAAIPGGSVYDKVYQFDVRSDGVYYNGRKIRGLAGGRYHYRLWEHYDRNKNPYGMQLHGFVDGGMCNNIPNWMERKTSAVTLCNRHCVILFSDLHCRGQTSTLRSDRHHCSNFWLSYFNDKARSLKGC